MALHEHPTLHHRPTSTSIRPVLPFPILHHCNLYVQLPCTWYSNYSAVSSEQRIPIILIYNRRSTRGTRKYNKVYPINYPSIHHIMINDLFPFSTPPMISCIPPLHQLLHSMHKGRRKIGKCVL